MRTKCLMSEQQLIIKLLNMLLTMINIKQLIYYREMEIFLQEILLLIFSNLFRKLKDIYYYFLKNKVFVKITKIFKNQLLIMIL